MVHMKHQVLAIFHPFLYFLHVFHMKKISQYNGFDVGFKVQNYVHGDHYLAHKNAYDLATHYDGHLLLYLLIHYYNLLMPIMFDEVQVHSFDFE